MKAFQICGFTGSGKTTTAEALISRLSEGNETVASVKDIHFQDFSIDTEGKNTSRHCEAGAEPVVARSVSETDFLFKKQMPLTEIVSHFTADWLVVEGYQDFPLPKIVCGKSIDEVDAFLDDHSIAIAGIFANHHKQHKGLRVFNPLIAEDLKDLVHHVRETVFPMLPYVDSACCRLCGMSCTEFVDAVIQKRKQYSDCTIRSQKIQLSINGKELKIVPFVQRLLYNSVIGVVSELDGYKENDTVTIQINAVPGNR
ncbi:molybdopterin-guanine dinucleotide biosynthesis protein B [bacterium]|nr:molybdopterin-guanine dinucleotide biosynthesis protein B [bacterium]